jgi:hypothetical protein
MIQLLEARNRWMFGDRLHHEQTSAVAVPATSAKDKLAILP